MDDSMMEDERDLSQRVTFRLLLPASAAGSVIGPKGESIKKIRESCSSTAYLRIPEMPPSPERLLLVTCTLEDIPVIITQLCRPIFKGLKDDTSIPSEHHNEILLLVNSHQAGRLVGKGGENLKTLRVETGCIRFKMYKDRLPLSEERVCEISGPDHAIAAAVQRSMEILEAKPSDHDHLHYMPSEIHGNERGDFGGYLRFKDSGSYGYKRERSYSNNSSFDRNNSSFDRNNSQRFERPLTPPPRQRYPSDGMRSRDRSPVQDRYRDNSRKRDRGFRDRSPVRGMVHKDIYIDDCYTKHVIGTRGVQISKIRKQSGAEVKIASDDTVVKGERTIRLSGRQADIDYALNMINAAIAEKISLDQKNNKSSQIAHPDFEYVNELFDRICAVVPFEDTHDDNPDIVTEEISIDNNEVSTVIGPKGVRIKDIRNYTRSSIDIESDEQYQGSGRKISFSGTRRQVHRAIYMITNISKVMR